MQVFSKLQRSGIIEAIIKLLFIFLINILSSFSLSFPMFLSAFIIADELFYSFIFVLLFSITHNYNVFMMGAFLLFIKFFVIDFIKSMFDKNYQLIVSVVTIYFMLFLYFYIYLNIDIQKVIIILIVNVFIDIVICKVFNCSLKSY